jgi:hypothetical protein
MYRYDLRQLSVRLRAQWLRRDLPIMLLILVPMATLAGKNFLIALSAVPVLILPTALIRLLQFSRMKLMEFHPTANQLLCKVPVWGQRAIDYSDIRDVSIIYTSLRSQTVMIWWSPGHANALLKIEYADCLVQASPGDEGHPLESNGQVRRVMPSLVDELRKYIPDSDKLIREVGKRKYGVEQPPSC